MLKSMLSCLVFIYAFVFVLSGDGDFGPGIWNVKKVDKCPEDAQFRFKFAIQKTKLNRTCDGFNADMYLDQDLDDSFGVRIDVCQHCDGGCKPSQVIADESIVNLIKKFAEGNFQSACELAGLETAGFPLAKGDYKLENYVYNPCELPPNSVYGTFDAKVFLIKDQVEVACLLVTVEFMEDVKCICAPPEDCE